MSTLEVSNLNDGTTTVATTFVTNGSAKAWADIASAGSLSDSFNVSTLTDVGSGDRSINLSSAMGSANFAANSTIIYAHGSSGHGVRNAPVASKTASVINVDTGSTNGSGQFSFQDQPSGLSVDGDLA